MHQYKTLFLIVPHSKTNYNDNKQYKTKERHSTITSVMLLGITLSLRGDNYRVA